MKLLIEFPYHPDRFHVESVEQRAALVEAFKNAKPAELVDLEGVEVEGPACGVCVTGKSGRIYLASQGAQIYAVDGEAKP